MKPPLARKPVTKTPLKPRNTPLPKWRVDDDARNEPAVCGTIRRNIQADSQRVRNLERDIRVEQAIIRAAEAAKRSARTALAEVIEQARQLPHLPAPDIPIHATSKLRRLALLLRRLGQFADAYSLWDGGERAAAILAARRRAAEIVEKSDNEIAEARRAQQEYHAEIDGLLMSLNLQESAFHDEGCHGDSFNSYVHLPSSRP